MSLIEPVALPLRDPACWSTVDALEDDPFYRAITVEFAGHGVRRAALLRYFAYCIHEGRRLGRTVHAREPELGVAVWLLPQAAEVQKKERVRKMDFLHVVLGKRGRSNYERIVDFMSAHAAKIVPGDAWYLSIIAVGPEAQGRGLGGRLAAPTLAEADAAGAVCYVETFSLRNLAFYERLGFVAQARIEEPTTGSDYTMLVREPVVM